jgi:acyl-CoA reductase-like NAD-dependent aldehyde dehydrogenase
MGRLSNRLILRRSFTRIEVIRLAYNFARTEACIAKVHAATAQDVDKAVHAAKAALMRPSWKKLPGTERGRLMSKLADLIELNKEILASIEAWDNGERVSSASCASGASDNSPESLKEFH